MPKTEKPEEDDEDDDEDEISPAPSEAQTELMRRRSKQLSMLSGDEYETLINKTPEAVEAFYTDTVAASHANELVDPQESDDYDPDKSVHSADVNRVFDSAVKAAALRAKQREAIAPLISAANEKVKVAYKKAKDAKKSV